MEQNLSQYKIFYEVANAGNISKAAKELYISQPAISKSIRKLEENLGVSLFTRSSRGVQLTEEGQLLFEHTKAAFDALSRGEHELSRIREFHIGQLHIGVSNTLCRYILLPYLKDFIDAYPHIKVTIDNQSTTHTLTMLEQNQLDLGLVGEPAAKRSLVYVPVMEIEDVFVATPHYLENLRLREGADCDVFQVGNLMLLDRSNMTRRHIDDYLTASQIATNQLLEVTTMDMLIEFARIGLGIGCVIRQLIQQELDSGQLVEIPLAIPVPKRTISFAYYPQRVSSALQMFLDMLQKIPE